VTLAADSVSPPHSLSVQADQPAYISRPIKITSNLSCEFDAKIDSWSGESWFFVVQNADWRNPDEWEVAWSKKNGQMMLIQYSLEAASQKESAAYPVEAAPPTDTWLHVRLEVTVGGNAVLTVTGLPALTATVPVPTTTTSWC
jgi:hypothetical protein